MSLRNVILFSLLASGFSWVGYVSYRWGIADYYANQAIESMDSWKGDVSRDDWTEAHLLLARALELDPTHPMYHQRMSRLYGLSSLASSGGVDFWETLEKASLHMDESVSMRPQWADAIVEGLRYNYFPSLDIAAIESELVEAVRYGPQTPVVLTTVVPLGVAHFDQFSNDGKQATIAAMTNGLVSHVGYVRENITLQYGRLPDELSSLVSESLYQRMLGIEWRPAEAVLFIEHSDLIWSQLNTKQQAVLQEKIKRLIGKRKMQFRESDLPSLANYVCGTLENVDCV